MTHLSRLKKFSTFICVSLLGMMWDDDQTFEMVKKDKTRRDWPETLSIVFYCPAISAACVSCVVVYSE